MQPFYSLVNFSNGKVTDYHNKAIRKYKDMENFFKMYLTKDIKANLKEKTIYESYEIRLPKKNGNLSWCTTIIYPGDIAGEYFMTKGHFHKNDISAELYLCIQGEGYIIMQNHEGKFIDCKIVPGKAISVPPEWGHRVINSDKNNKLIFVAVYASDAGHDYAFIEEKGFKKLLISENGKPKFIDNPNYQK